MKQTCPDCKTIIEINEDRYSSEKIIQKECPLCGTIVEFSVPRKNVSASLKPQVVVQYVQDEQSKIEIATLKSEIRNMKEQQEFLSSLEVTSSQSPVIQEDIGKNKVVAILFALFLGNLGIHKFYLRQYIWGVIYLIFCWSYIPGVIAFIEAIIYLCMDKETFKTKYN